MRSDKPGRAIARSGTPHKGVASRGNSQNTARASGRPIAASFHTEVTRCHAGVGWRRRRIPVPPGAAAPPAPATRRPGRAAATADPGRAGRWRRARTARSRAGCAIAQVEGFRGLDREHRREQRTAGIASECEMRHRQHAPTNTSASRSRTSGSGRRQDVAATSSVATIRSRCRVAPATAAATAAGRPPPQQRPQRGFADPASAARRHQATAPVRGNSASARRQAWRCCWPEPGPSGGCPGSRRR